MRVITNIAMCIVIYVMSFTIFGSLFGFIIGLFSIWNILLIDHIGDVIGRKSDE